MIAIDFSIASRGSMVGAMQVYSKGESRASKSECQSYRCTSLAALRPPVAKKILATVREQYASPCAPGPSNVAKKHDSF